MPKGKLETYSYLIAWENNNPEAGDFGWSGRATSYEQAERKARAAMKASHLDSCRGDGESVRECCQPYMDGGVFGGRVIEATKGAIWSAGELEAALRDLLKWGARKKASGPAWDNARKVIAELTK